MLKIDEGKMFCAIGAANEAEAGFPECKAFLNRRTGEIVFLHESEGDDERLWGEDVTVDGVFDRASIGASPDEWLEIPRIYNEDSDCDIAACALQFLEEHGIDAELM